MARRAPRPPSSLAVVALGYLAVNAEHLERFLALTGIGPDEIRKAAAEPGFLAGVLDYVAGNEALLRAVAAHAGVAPEETRPRAPGPLRRRLAARRAVDFPQPAARLSRNSGARLQGSRVSLALNPARSNTGKTSVRRKCDARASR